MVKPLRHRQTKEAATDMFYLTPPRHISTLYQTRKSARLNGMSALPRRTDVVRAVGQVRIVPKT